MSMHASSPAESLPPEWVERIWAVMRANYGASFDRQWECPAGADPVRHVEQLKAHWAKELRGCAQAVDAVVWALEHLPEFPPNLPQFKALLRAAPMPEQPRLPPPAASPAVARRVLAAIRPKRGNVNPMSWAIRLAQRERDGAVLTIGQRESWRRAFGLTASATPETLLSAVHWDAAA